MATPLYVEGVNGHDPLPPVGHVVLQGVPSPMRQSDVAETWVVDAYGNVEARVVLVAKKYAAVGEDVAVRVVASVHEVSIPVVPPETLADGHVVLQGVPSPVKQSVVAESAVVEAYGNCEAMSVEVAKKVAAVGVEVHATSPLASTARMRLARLVSHTLLVAVKSEVEALVKFCVAVHQLAFPRLSPQSLIAPVPVYDDPLSVVSLVRAPRVPPSAMPEMVENVNCALPMVVEAMTRPVASVARSDMVAGEVRYVAPVLVNIVVDACVKKVVDASTIVFFNHSGVVVD